MEEKAKSSPPRKKKKWYLSLWDWWDKWFPLVNVFLFIGLPFLDTLLPGDDGFLAFLWFMNWTCAVCLVVDSILHPDKPADQEVSD